MQIAAKTGWTFSQIGDLTRRELLSLYYEIKREQTRFLAQQMTFFAGLLKGAGYLSRGNKESASAGERIFRQSVDNFKKMMLEENNGE